jgi:CheY-like chemotaxis protein
VLSGREALARLTRETFDAVLLDLRCSDLSPDEVVNGIHQIRPSLIGHVLVITGEVADQETLDVVERHLLLHVPQDRLWQDLRGYLRALFRISPTTHLA